MLVMAPTIGDRVVPRVGGLSGGGGLRAPRAPPQQLPEQPLPGCEQVGEQEQRGLAAHDHPAGRGVQVEAQVGARDPAADRQRRGDRQHPGEAPGQQERGRPWRDQHRGHQDDADGLQIVINIFNINLHPQNMKAY